MENKPNLPNWYLLLTEGKEEQLRPFRENEVNTPFVETLSFEDWLKVIEAGNLAIWGGARPMNGDMVCRGITIDKMIYATQNSTKLLTRYGGWLVSFRFRPGVAGWAMTGNGFEGDRNWEAFDAQRSMRAVKDAIKDFSQLDPKWLAPLIGSEDKFEREMGVRLLGLIGRAEEKLGKPSDDSKPRRGR